MRVIIPFIFIVSVVVISSCTSNTPREKELQNIINKPLRLEVFETVHKGSMLLSFEELRSGYDFISVVYLKDGCEPCYPKFVQWHQKMDSLDYLPNHTVLFIIQGESYMGFMDKILDLGFLELDCHIIMDTNLTFYKNNNDISGWMVESSLLIDHENRIKMVGAPWINQDMIKLFYDIVRKGESQLSISNEQ